MKKEAEDFNPEERQDPTSGGESGDEGEESEWTEDEDGISDRRWETGLAILRKKRMTSIAIFFKNIVRTQGQL